MAKPLSVHEFLVDAHKGVQEAIGDLQPGVYRHWGLDLERLRWRVEGAAGDNPFLPHPVVQAIDSLMLEALEPDAHLRTSL